METLPKLMYGFNSIPTRTADGFFAEIGKLTLQFIWKFKGSRADKAISKKNKVGGPTFPNFKTY